MLVVIAIDCSLNCFVSNSFTCVFVCPDVFPGAQSTASRRRGTQAFVVAHLPSHTLLGTERFAQDRQRRRSVARAHTVAGILQHPSSSFVVAGSLSHSGTLPARLQLPRRSLIARDILMEVAEELHAKDEVDHRSASKSQASHMHLLEKAPSKRKSVSEEAEQHRRSLQFRDRLKSVALPMAEKKAVL